MSATPSRRRFRDEFRATQAATAAAVHAEVDDATNFDDAGAILPAAIDTNERWASKNSCNNRGEGCTETSSCPWTSRTGTPTPKSSECHAEFENNRHRTSPLLLKKELILEDYISANAVRKKSSECHAEFGLRDLLVFGFVN
jgi:hypothetical protein